MPYTCIDCKSNGIKKHASYGKIGTRKILYCAPCGKQYKDCVNLYNKKCLDCKTITATYNKIGSKAREYCSTCVKKYEGYEQKCTKKCEDCKTKNASFALQGTKDVLYCASCCKKHGGEYINLRNKMCIECNIKHPIYGKIGSKTRLYCKECSGKHPNMIDLNHESCINEWCDVQVNNNKYKGYCFNCFRHEYPDHKLVQNYKSKELLVVDYIKLQEYPKYVDAVKIGYRKIKWVLDKAIGSSKRRPDICKKFETFYLIIEIDENQHTNYDCENKRMMQLVQDAGMNIAIIRINPDAYVDSYGNKVPSCFRNTINGTVLVKKNLEDWNHRLAVLNYYIKQLIRHPPTKTLTEIKLFYNDYTEGLNLYKNE